ncbi:uncharacterized protein LOC111949275 [Oryzias latipes]|uniref:uncharacterized protein LOC110017657 n=1 Tax=Oryzias latipes TaxID=8090 RepID=UPI000CE19AED|nr:uncharacterized protein LOC110017657 [Oryzias latipes]XP_023814866.1 uncharacterized protein LOC111947982 [Oryzias latipes]XP_023816930.1 uncharacterized protein LOC111948384 [Oryzias latipes]XP_023816931.1 uncharacterized protein LOC111948385 [Oryzias latipes]XP_023821915.1 uncharacterized protein LOC111949275 [Oryzias latipes]
MSLPDSEASTSLRLKELEVELLRLKIKKKEVCYEFELRKIKEENYRQICLKELELQQATSVVPPPSFCVTPFDVDKCVKSVPPLGDRDINEYFALFENAARVLQWPKTVWSLLLRRVLTGKAQEAVVSLPATESLDYDRVKAEVLHAYALEPEVCGGDGGFIRKTNDLADDKALINQHDDPVSVNQVSDLVGKRPEVFPAQARRQEQDESAEKDFLDLSDSFMAHFETPGLQPVEIHVCIGGHEARVPDPPPLGCLPFSGTASKGPTVFPLKQLILNMRYLLLTSHLVIGAPRNQSRTGLQCQLLKPSSTHTQPRQTFYRRGGSVMMNLRILEHLFFKDWALQVLSYSTTKPVGGMNQCKRSARPQSCL